MLSIPLHIFVAICVGIAAFLLSVLLGKYLMGKGANELVVVVVIGLFTGTALYVFDRFVPAKCPKCGSPMYGDGGSRDCYCYAVAK
jgi:hypothetical protein